MLMTSHFFLLSSSSAFPHQQIMGTQPPQPGLSWSESSRLAGALTNTSLIGTQKECRDQLVHRHAANAPTKNMTQEVHLKIQDIWCWSISCSSLFTCSHLLHINQRLSNNFTVVLSWLLDTNFERLWFDYMITLVLSMSHTVDSIHSKTQLIIIEYIFFYIWSEGGICSVCSFIFADLLICIVILLLCWD